MATGSAIRARRRELGYTQTGLAREIGTTRQTIASWEAGRHRPSIELMQRLSSELERKPEQLIPGWLSGDSDTQAAA